MATYCKSRVDIVVARTYAQGSDNFVTVKKTNFALRNVHRNSDSIEIDYLHSFVGNVLKTQYSSDYSIEYC